MGLICIRVARLSTGDTRRVVRDRGEFNAPYTLIATVVSNVYFMSDILRAAVTLVLIPQPPSFCPFFFFLFIRSRHFLLPFKCCGCNHNHQVSYRYVCVFFSLSRLRAVINNGGKRKMKQHFFLK